VANTTREPTIGSITITGKDSLFWNSQDSRLILTGLAPNVPVVRPTVGSVSITGQQPSRGIGLITQGLAPTLGLDIVKYPTEGSITITELQPDRSVEAPPQQTILVPIGGATLTGSTPDSGGREARPTVGSLAISSSAPGTLTARPAKDALTLSGGEEDLDPVTAPTVVLSGTQALIGTIIENTNAVEDTKNRYNICDVSGFKAKPGELVRRWDGMWVLPEFNEPRNQQDFAYSRSEKQRGAKRPEPVGSETMVSDLYPNGVTSDDL
jgi:hypothetical protein